MANDQVNNILSQYAALYGTRDFQLDRTQQPANVTAPATTEATPQTPGAVQDGFTTTAITPFGRPSERLGCCCPCPPNPNDSTHPEGTLRVGENGVITTPGGYTVEATKQFEWIITGPDGKTTRIWGDPHVDEGDGGKWDFKRDSIFVLGDGTRINVTTAPFGKDGKMTVTKELEIIAGNQRVLVNDIDKGKGKPGRVTNDGASRVNAFHDKDAFVMGKESDDWAFQGKEVLSSEDGGERFNLGAYLETGAEGADIEHFNDPFRKRMNALGKIFEGVNSLFSGLGGLFGQDRHGAYNPLLGPHGGCWNRNRPDDLHSIRMGLQHAFTSILRMFSMMSQMHDLRGNLPPTFRHY